jgi:hypothetical protein
MTTVKKNLARLRQDRVASRIAELTKLIEFHKSSVPPAPNQTGIDHADKSVKAAGQAQSTQEKWAHCTQAFRFLIWSMDNEEREVHCKALRREADAKLDGWRKDAVLDLVGREKPATAVDAAALSLALYLLDEHFDNVYFRLDAVAIRIRSLRWVMLTLVAIVLAASWYLPRGASNSFLFDPQRASLVLLAGAIGAALSNALSVLGVGSKIPGLLGEHANWFVRLPLGALGAVAIVAIIQSGLLPVTQPTDLAMYAWAVTGGFSDQLLNKVIAQVESAIDK